MGRTLLLLPCIGLTVMLSGCGDGHQEDLRAVQQDMWTAYVTARDETADTTRRRALILSNPLYLDAVRRRDSLFAYGPSIRHLQGDSVMHADSVMYANIVLNRISDEIYGIDGDTLKAAFTYLHYLPWLSVFPAARRAEEVRFYAETLGDAIGITLSPNMVKMTYQAFTHARQIALLSGDTTLLHLADSSYKAVARRVLTMPDSVRAAFGPAPDRPARVPWVLATLAATFIAASVASGWRRASQSI